MLPKLSFKKMEAGEVMDREELAQRILFLTESKMVTDFCMKYVFKGKTEKEVKDGKSKD